jgi:hypothetical protein
LPALRGAILVEYALEGAVLYMRHSLVFDREVEDLVLGRGIDPDQEVWAAGGGWTETYNDVVETGSGVLAVAYGAASGRSLGLYAPAGDYPVRATATRDWPYTDFRAVAGGAEDVRGQLEDAALAVAWTIPRLRAGQVVSLCAAYICAVDSDGVLALATR